MNYLLDTHLLIWIATNSPRLPREAHPLIEDPDSNLFFSAASIWEIAIKHGLEREDFVLDPRLLRRGLLDQGYAELSVTSEHGIHVGFLPPIHKDPFDRLLIAQSLAEGITLLTVDPVVARYPGPIRKL